MIKSFHLKDLLYLVFIICLPFSWAVFGVGSLYRNISIITIMFFLIKHRFVIRCKNENKSLLYAFMFFSLVCMFSVLWGVELTSGIRDTVGMLLILAIAAIFSSVSLNKEKRSMVELCWIICGIIAGAIFLMGSSTEVGKYGARKSLMILGTSTDPNEFASLFVVVIPIAFCKLLETQKNISRLFYFVVCSIGAFVVFRTGSRGALLGVICSIIVTLWVNRNLLKKNFFYMVLAIVLFFAVIAKYIMPQIPKEIFERMSIEALKIDEGSERLSIWLDALKQINLAKPLRWFIGYGSGGLQTQYSGGQTSTMHNQLLQIFANYGAVGIVFYLNLLWQSFKRIVRKNRQYIGAFCGMMATSLTISMGPSYKILWILLMMAFIGCQEDVVEINEYEKKTIYNYN